MFILVLAFTVFIFAFYWYATRNHDYWMKRNVKHDPPIPLLGNNYRTLFGLKSVTNVACEYYNRFPNEKVVGYYRGCTPELIIRDLDIAKDILTTDFYNFYKRGLGKDGKHEPMLANLFHSDSGAWKLLRQRLTPAFTTAKLKGMFPLVVNCAEKLQTVCKNIALRDGECDARDIMARFTTEFIGACGFGIEMDTINENRSYFRELGKIMFNTPFKQLIKVGIWQLFPELGPFIQISKKEVEVSVIELVKKIREQRQNKPIGRNDFVDLLLEIEAEGKITGESLDQKNEDGTPKMIDLELDLKLFAAQVLVFFAAGFETSSSATSFTLHKLAYHPEIQSDIQKEIDEVLLKYDNKLCYDAIAEMKLLDMAFKEAMRMFPSLGTLHRKCVTKHTIPSLGFSIDRDVNIVIPLQAIQNDEKYFENPKEFNPRRFEKDNLQRNILHNYAYMPFGEGPRKCIGERLGKMQSLAGLAAVLSQFTVEPSAQSQTELKINEKSNVVQSVLGGVPIKVRSRETTSL